jgi:periplasmic divalent cation tolerance protein
VKELTMNAMIVLTTTDDSELAGRIAKALVETGEAACVNIVPGIRSIYRWEGKICDEGESLLIIKSAAEKFDRIRSLIRSLHSYQVPEVVAVSIAEGDSEYLHWLLASLRTD